MAIIAIDLGTKKTGMAISYEPYIVSEDLPIIFESRQRELIGKLGEIIIEKKADKVIIGVPLNIKGEDTHKSLEIKEVGERLKRFLNGKYNVEIMYLDESLSSKRAGEYMDSKNKNSKLDDSIAAKIILQEYINNINY